MDPYKEIAAAQDGKDFSENLHFCNTAAFYLLVELFAHLFINLTFRLCDKVDIISVFPVLRKKVKPFQTVTLGEGAGIKEPAAFVKHYDTLHFFSLVGEVMEVEGKAAQAFYVAELLFLRVNVLVCLCGEFGIGRINKLSQLFGMAALFEIIHVNFKVGNHISSAL